MVARPYRDPAGKYLPGGFGMAKKKTKKVVRYRRPLNINVGMIIFALIFAYIPLYVYTYITGDKSESYEVSYPRLG